MDEREFIAQMDRNQRIMIRIDKLFFAAGFLCVIINGFVSIWEVMFIPIHMIKGSFGELTECLLAPISVVLSILSSCKHEKWTTAALGVFLVRVTLIMLFSDNGGLSAFVFFAFTVPQFLCMRQYEKLSILKGQFGYPGFNAEIYMHTPKYNSSGFDYSSRTRRKKSQRNGRSRMDDVDPPPTNGEYEDIFSNRRKPL